MGLCPSVMAWKIFSLVDVSRKADCLYGRCKVDCELTVAL